MKNERCAELLSKISAKATKATSKVRGVKPVTGVKPTTTAPKPAKDMTQGDLTKITSKPPVTGAPKDTKQLIPGEGKVGTYGQLITQKKKGDNVAAHHLPNAQYMKEKGIPKKDGISLR